MADSTPRTLVQLWLRCRERGDTVLLTDDHQAATARECVSSSVSFARALLNSGCHRGDAVLLQVGNGADFLVGFFGSLLAGCTVVLLDRETDVSERALPLPGTRCVGTLRSHENNLVRWYPAGLSGSVSLADVVRPYSELSSENNDAEYPAPMPGRECLPEDVAVVLCTSGTSGLRQLRGIVKTHENLMEEVRNLHTLLGGTPRHVLSMLPWSYIYGLLHHLLLPVYSEGSIHYVSRYTPSELPALIARHDINLFVAVPAIYRVLVQLTAVTPCPSLEWAVTSGAPLDESTAVMIKTHLGWPLVEIYGSTETGGICVNTNKSDNPYSVGVPMPGIELSIGESQTESGRVKVRGKTVSNRAFTGGMAEDLLDVDGWYDTADMGALDGLGELQLQGRTSRFIKVSGKRISLDDIEARLLVHEHIVDVAARLISDRLHGEVAAVDVVLAASTGLEAGDINTWCRTHLPSHYRPRLIRVVDSIPRLRLSKSVNG